MTDEKTQSLEKLVRTNGRGLVQINVKLSEILEKLKPEAQESSAPPPSSVSKFELLSDLVEGLDRAIAALEFEPMGPPTTPGIWGRIFGNNKIEGRTSEAQNPVLQGLESLRQRIINDLYDDGITLISNTGLFNADHHCVIGTTDKKPKGVIAETSRRGYLQIQGEETKLLRPSLVIVGQSTVG